MRDYEQAARDIADIEPFFEEFDACRYGLWTNGLEFFFLRKKATRFQVDAEPIGDWPPADESLDDRGVLSRAHARRADPEMLRTAFRRCHNFIHGNEGMPKDAAFWQFLYLIFCKMSDERTRRRDQRRFWAGPQEQFTAAGRKAIRRRIEPLFDEVKQEYRAIFDGGEEIKLSARALAFVAEKVGFDRRGNTLYKRSPEGEEITEARDRPAGLQRDPGLRAGRPAVQVPNAPSSSEASVLNAYRPESGWRKYALAVLAKVGEEIDANRQPLSGDCQVLWIVVLA